MKGASTSARHRSSTPLFHWWLAGVALALLVPALILATASGFNGLYGQDPYAYFDYSTGPLRDSISAFEPPPPFFWPPGYPFLAALLSFVLGRVPLAAQIVSLAAGALVPVFTALFAREIWDDIDSSSAMPIIAGLLSAFTGQLWLSSIVVMSDTTGLAAATAGMWCIARFGRQSDSQHRSQLRWLALAAAAMSYAVLTRWAYAIVAIPCTGYALTVLGKNTVRRAVALASVASAIVIVVLSPVLPALLQVLFGVPEPGHTVAFAGNLQIHSWNPVNAFRREFVTPDGVLQHRLLNGVYYAAAPAHPMYFTPFVAPLVLVGAWRVIRSRTRVITWLVLGWVLAIYSFHAGDPYQNLRFTLAYLPPLAILGGIGAAWSGRMLRQRHRWIPIIGGVSALAVMSAGGATRIMRFTERVEADHTTVRWVEERTGPNARVFAFELTSTLQHEGRLETHELFLLTPEAAADLLDDGVSTYLLVDVEDIRTQWRELAPYKMYAWLDSEVGLTEVGRHRNYTLFRVGPGL